jgi:hypothetical protein
VDDYGPEQAASTIDSLLAATSLHHVLHLVKRKTSDFSYAETTGY